MSPAEHTPKSLTELQAAVDSASGAYGRGMSEFERGAISPAEFGLLKRRMMRAEKALQNHKAEGTTPATHARLAPATLRALKALDAETDKRLSFAAFRQASGVKTRAYYPFVARLEDQRLITRYGDNSRDHGYGITFAGLQALARAEAR